MRRVLLFLAAVAVLGAPGSQAATRSFDSTQVTEIPDTLVVTANRVGIGRAGCVWPVSIVAQAALGGSTSLGNVLAARTGVDVRDYSGAGSVTTLSNWGTFNRHMLLLYDGRVVRDYSLGGFNLSEFSPSEFERVELVKGPQSAFYGSDAVGGVVSLVPRTMLHNRVTVSSLAGSQGYARNRLDACKKFGSVGIGGWAELLSTDNNRSNAGAAAGSFGARADFQSSDARYKLHATIRAFDDSLGIPGPVPPAGDTAPHLGDYASTSLFDYQKDKNISFDAASTWRCADGAEIRLGAFLDRKRLTFNSRYEEYWMMPVDTATAHTVYQKRSSGITGSCALQMAGLTASGGVDRLYGSLDYSNDVQAGTSSLPDRWTGGQHQTDVWSAVTASPTKSVKIDLSGRLSFVKNRAAQPAYNFGIVGDLANDWKMKFGYGFAFRLPSLADQFSTDAYTQGNPALKAEKSRTGVATLEYHSASKQFTGHLTYFDQQVRELIQYQYHPDLFLSVPQNVSRFRSRGVDGGVAVCVSSRFSVDVNAVFQHARQTYDATLQYVDAFYVPNLTWTASADYRISPAVTIGGGIRFLSDREITLFDGARKIIGRVYELSARASVRLSSHLTFTVSGEDLTNRKRPGTFGYTADDRDYPGPGRRVYAQVTASLGQ